MWICKSIRSNPLTTPCAGVNSQYGSGYNVTVAMSADEVTPAWLSAVFEQEVKSFDTKLCTEGQVGITVLITNVVYAKQSTSMPTSLAVKMHGPGEEQRQQSGAFGLYFKEIYAYHDFALHSSVPVSVPGVLGIWYDARDPYETMVHFNLVMTDLNVEYTPYKAAETFGVPPQKEWDEIYVATCL